jgi:hypothetical protein
MATRRRSSTSYWHCYDVSGDDLSLVGKDDTMKTLGVRVWDEKPSVYR